MALTGFVRTVTVVLMALVPVLITETVFEPAETEFVAALATYALVPSGVNTTSIGLSSTFTVAVKLSNRILLFANR